MLKSLMAGAGLAAIALAPQIQDIWFAEVSCSEGQSFGLSGLVSPVAGCLGSAGSALHG